MTSRQSVSGSSGDVTETEALKHTTVDGETICASGTTSWVYPGDAVSINITSTGTAKMEVRGGGGDGLETTECRHLQPVLGVNSPGATNGGNARFNMIPHEFRMVDTSGSENKITWTLFY